MLAWLAVTCSLSPLLVGHVIPDNVVYRGVQVVVKPEGIEVRYQLGMNEKTLRRELAARLQPEEAVSENDEQALAKFGDVILPLLAKQLNLEIEAAAVALTPVRRDLIRQHHAQLECIYWAAFSAPLTPAQLTLVDNNFAAAPGVQIMAVKSRGEIDLLQTDAPTLLVRAPVARLPSDDTAIPKASSRRLEAYFCRSQNEPAPARIPSGPASGEQGPSVTEDAGRASAGAFADARTSEPESNDPSGGLLAEQAGSQLVPKSSAAGVAEHAVSKFGWGGMLPLSALLAALLLGWLAWRAVAFRRPRIGRD